VGVGRTVEETGTDEDTKALAGEYKKLLLAMLQRREACRCRRGQQDHRPVALADTAGYASYLTMCRSVSCWRPRTSTPGCGC
jgi:hypothetical protein